MKNKWFSYIRIDREKGCVETSGISWEEFYHGIVPRPANLLLLTEGDWRNEHHTGLWLEYIPRAKLETCSYDDIGCQGDFCWVDFADPADLDAVTPQELAELLYFYHKVEPLHLFQFASLHNRFAYYSHDDDWYARVYMEQPEDFMAVAEHKILKELKGRKRSIAPLPEEIRAQLLAMFEQGAAVDFENGTDSSVTVYPIGSIRGANGIHEMLDRQRKSGAGAFHLWYDTRTKRWQSWQAQ